MKTRGMVYLEEFRKERWLRKDGLEIVIKKTMLVPCPLFPGVPAALSMSRTTLERCFCVQI